MQNRSDNGLIREGQATKFYADVRRQKEIDNREKKTDLRDLPSMDPLKRKFATSLRLICFAPTDNLQPGIKSKLQELGDLSSKRIAEIIDQCIPLVAQARRGEVSIFTCPSSRCSASSQR